MRSSVSPCRVHHHAAIGTVSFEPGSVLLDLEARIALLIALQDQARRSQDTSFNFFRSFVNRQSFRSGWKNGSTASKLTIFVL
jgi:hypothetical protein